jgi:serine phosphatase RsbU (regulator of sigma subunit)
VSTDRPGEPLRNSSGIEITALVSREALEKALASADEMALSLLIVDGRDAGRLIRLAERPVIAGRDPNLDIVLTDGGVSRLHCSVSVVNGEATVEDLGSTNGTFVDGRRIVRRAPLPVGSLLQIGEHLLRCERSSRRDLDRADEQFRDIQRAASYVQSLLPPPLSEGAIRTEWLLQPSARLGGDAFGYGSLDAHRFSLYLIDVSGHGVGAAMLSVSVLNVLREHALRDTDFTDPIQVLSTLNGMFQMERHNDQYFTMWYGVYDARDRMLTYATAGHHAGYLVSPARDDARPLRTSGSVIGAMADARFHAAATHIEAGSMLYLFSDGVFEIRTPERQWRLADFVPLLTRPMAADRNECRRLLKEVQAVCHPGPADDDFSLLVVTFP